MEYDLDVRGRITLHSVHATGCGLGLDVVLVVGSGLKIVYKFLHLQVTYFICIFEGWITVYHFCAESSKNLY